MLTSIELNKARSYFVLYTRTLENLLSPDLQGIKFLYIFPSPLLELGAPTGPIGQDGLNKIRRLKEAITLYPRCIFPAVLIRKEDIPTSITGFTGKRASALSSTKNFIPSLLYLLLPSPLPFFH